MGNSGRADTPAGRPGFRPVHPGRIVKRNIEALGITIEEFAKRIETSRQTVHAILSERSAVTPVMAARLGRVFNTSSQLWLNMQAAHDVWEPERSRAIARIRPFKWKATAAGTYARHATGGTAETVSPPSTLAARKRSTLR
jgi:addiction module HigA family antidote